MGRTKSKKRMPASLGILDTADQIDDQPDRKWLDPYDGLNVAQKKVVAWDSGIVIVVACAGSGKTHSVVNRIYRLYRDGHDMSRLLATTFTKRGAGEMNDRLKLMGCPVGDGATRIGTFHSITLGIIRDGSPWENYQVDASNGMRYALKNILGYRQMNWRGADLTELEGFIGSCKNALVAPDDIKLVRGAKPFDPRQPGVTSESRMGEAYCLYEEERDRRGVITFDDMLKLAVEHLRQDQDAMTRWSGRYRHIIVDEYQDTNLAQYELMRLLSQDADSLMVVGDARQIIFGFRGSDLGLTTTFQERFGATVIDMNINYRSLPTIVGHANQIGQTFPHEIMRSPAVPDRTGDPTVSCQPSVDFDAEAEVVVERVMGLHQDGLVYRDMMVCSRTNAQSRPFEEVCIRRKIPHRVLGGVDFYSRKEVADILAYMRLAVNDNDDQSCSRAINRPFRYIGRASVERMLSEAVGAISMLEVARHCSQYDLDLKARQVSSVQGFVRAVDLLRVDLDPGNQPPGPTVSSCAGLERHNKVNLPVALSNLVHNIRYEDWLIGDEGSDTAENSRLSNVRELIRTSGRFRSAEKMLMYIERLRAERKKRKKGGADLLEIGTIHKFKGQERVAVFVAGCAEGILPHGRSDDLEEEKRLFYTAITRARDYLMVTWPTTALVGGRQVRLLPSRFIAEAGLLKGEKAIHPGTTVEQTIKLGVGVVDTEYSHNEKMTEKLKVNLDRQATLKGD